MGSGCSKQAWGQWNVRGGGLSSYSVLRSVGAGEDQSVSCSERTCCIFAGNVVVDNSMTVQENMTIDQKWVGWLLGKGGMVCHEIEVSTGAQVRIDQATKSLGYSTVQI